MSTVHATDTFTGKSSGKSSLKKVPNFSPQMPRPGPGLWEGWGFGRCQTSPLPDFPPRRNWSCPNSTAGAGGSCCTRNTESLSPTGGSLGGRCLGCSSDADLPCTRIVRQGSLKVGETLQGGNVGMGKLSQIGSTWRRYEQGVQWMVRQRDEGK